jgi:hypothetical protein
MAEYKDAAKKSCCWAGLPWPGAWPKGKKRLYSYGVLCFVIAEIWRGWMMTSSSPCMWVWLVFVAMAALHLYSIVVTPASTAWTARWRNGTFFVPYLTQEIVGVDGCARGYCTTKPRNAATGTGDAGVDDEFPGERCGLRVCGRWTALSVLLIFIANSTRTDVAIMCLGWCNLCLLTLCVGSQRAKHEQQKSQTQEFMHALREKSESLSVKNTFIATLTHEIRNFVSKYGISDIG